MNGHEMSVFDTHAAVSAEHIEALHADLCSYQRKAGGDPLSLKVTIDETELADGAGLPEVNRPFGASPGRYARCSIRTMLLDHPAYGDTITDTHGVVWTVLTFKRIPAWWELTLMSDQRAGFSAVQGRQR
jgi:hypothetical protein